MFQREFQRIVLPNKQLGPLRVPLVDLTLTPVSKPTVVL